MLNAEVGTDLIAVCVSSDHARLDSTAFLDEHRAFVELLENHRCREDHALYPAIDRQLGRAARAELLRHLRVLL